jgi:cation/acetate symporter
MGLAYNAACTKKEREYEQKAENPAGSGNAPEGGPEMIYTPSILATILFSIIVITVFGLSIYFARQSSSSKGYFAAGGTIPWGVNGIAVAGYDGFLYSIGYLAGWIAALFVIAEPLKRLGKFMFADALDALFNYPAIRLIAGISTLVASIFYLIPQMVGAGALVTPLLGFPHWVGVVFVGGIVSIDQPGYTVVGEAEAGGRQFVKLENGGVEHWWLIQDSSESLQLTETLTVTATDDGRTLYNGQPKEAEAFYPVGHMSKLIVNGEEVDATGSVGPFKFIETIEEIEVVRFIGTIFAFEGDSVSLWYQEPNAGSEVMRPGLKFKVDEGSTPLSKITFVSLMAALFFGTSALPHVLIRYYTVPSPKDARKSTILAIAAIGFFYILTMYIGFGAMVNGVIDVQSDNMSAPLLANALIGLDNPAIIYSLEFSGPVYRFSHDVEGIRERAPPSRRLTPILILILILILIQGGIDAKNRLDSNGKRTTGHL